MDYNIMQNNKKDAELAIMYLDRIATGMFPFSNSALGIDSDLNSAEIVRSVYYIRDIIKELMEENGRNHQEIQKLLEDITQGKLKRSR